MQHPVITNVPLLPERVVELTDQDGVLLVLRGLLVDARDELEHVLADGVAFRAVAHLPPGLTVPLLADLEGHTLEARGEWLGQPRRVELLLAVAAVPGTGTGDVHDDRTGRLAVVDLVRSTHTTQSRLAKRAPLAADLLTKLDVLELGTTVQDGPVHGQHGLRGGTPGLRWHLHQTDLHQVRHIGGAMTERTRHGVVLGAGLQVRTHLCRQELAQPVRSHRGELRVIGPLLVRVGGQVGHQLLDLRAHERVATGRPGLDGLLRCEPLVLATPERELTRPVTDAGLGPGAHIGGEPLDELVLGEPGRRPTLGVARQTGLGAADRRQVPSRAQVVHHERDVWVHPRELLDGVQHGVEVTASGLPRQPGNRHADARWFVSLGDDHAFDVNLLKHLVEAHLQREGWATRPSNLDVAVLEPGGSDADQSHDGVALGPASRQLVVPVRAAEPVEVEDIVEHPVGYTGAVLTHLNVILGDRHPDDGIGRVVLLEDRHGVVQQLLDHIDGPTSLGYAT